MCIPSESSPAPRDIGKPLLGIRYLTFLCLSYMKSLLLWWSMSLGMESSTQPHSHLFVFLLNSLSSPWPAGPAGSSLCQLALITARAHCRLRLNLRFTRALPQWWREGICRTSNLLESSLWTGKGYVGFHKGVPEPYNSCLLRWTSIYLCHMSRIPCLGVCLVALHVAAVINQDLPAGCGREGKWKHGV